MLQQMCDHIFQTNLLIFQYKPLSPGAIAYMYVAREIAERGKAKEEENFDSNVVSIHYKKDGESA